MTSRWRHLSSDETVRDYDHVVAQRLAEVRQAGGSAHAEADLVASLGSEGGTVLDAGCGTGRVAWRLAQMGYAVTGVDSDARMLSRARAAQVVDTDLPAPTREPVFVEADLTSYREGTADIDVVIAAGNVVPLLAPGTLTDAVRALSSQLRPGGLLIWGFGLHEHSLPSGCPITPIEEVEVAVEAAGLHRLHRWGTWDREPFSGGYVVEVHARAGPSAADAHP